MKKPLSIAALFLVAMTGTALADAKYSTVIKGPPSAKVGTKAAASIIVKPQGDYHMNADYPTTLTISAPDGVQLAKAKQTAKEAVKLDKSELEFQVVFTPESAGKKSFTGELRFAVCRDTDCNPQTEKVSFTVDVK
ncbi:Hypothetical protein A7982_07983 [Minicystis rosea]|nr:Hypothetical protein A7982_07983 [Minicystis rosea]